MNLGTKSQLLVGFVNISIVRFESFKIVKIKIYNSTYENQNPGINKRPGLSWDFFSAIIIGALTYDSNGVIIFRGLNSSRYLSFGNSIYYKN